MRFIESDVILLLDIDGVLQFPRASFFDAMERDYAWASSYGAFLGELFTDSGYLATLEGRGDFREVADRILRRHVEGLSADAFLERWAREGIEMNHALLDALPALGYDAIYLASNQEALRGALVERLYTDHAWLSGTFLSHRIGSSKPAAEYFARVLRELRCPAEACIFLDDAAPNVASAAAAGMRAAQFVDNEQALAALRLY